MSPTWQKLASLAETPVDIASLCRDRTRLDRFSLEVAGLYADLSRHRVTDETLETLLQLARERQVLEQAAAMARGETVNPTEGRAALHTALRSASPSPALPDDCYDQMMAGRSKLRLLSDAIRTGAWKGVTGREITDVINIGIGGSDLGPRMVCEALREYRDGPRIHFIANVDGAEILALLPTLDAETTLIVISSKTFTTGETMLNAATALRWLGDTLGISAPASSPHCIGITSDAARARQFGIPEEQLLTFGEAIGGRYSVWSPIGLAVCVAVGHDAFESFLEGGGAMDQHFLHAAPDGNLPLLMGLIAVWYNNFLGAQSHAIIPYCQRLRLLVDYLQQLDMESSGKSALVNSQAQGEDGKPDTGPVIWGQTGTNGQHAFFQLLHQGTKLVPVDFIGLARDDTSDPEHHRVLMANMIAQGEALMTGRPGDDPHRHYPGNRPSTTILLDTLSPRTLGALVALYEHKVFVQCALWGINPFDQWGVELGKALAGDILSGKGGHDPSTLALLRRTGLA